MLSRLLAWAIVVLAGLAAGSWAGAAEQSPIAIPARETPPIIILKLDDLRQLQGGRVHPRWQRVADYLEQKQVKYSIGVICQTLESAHPNYVEWIRSRQESGNVEFWFHGWDHAVHQVDGTKYNEFNGRPYDQQKERLDKAQKLAKEKLGFAFTTFGPPGGEGNGVFNQDTLRVLLDDQDMRVMLYPAPFNDPKPSELTLFARKLVAESQGKLRILDVAWQARLERPLFKPNLEAFMQGYAKLPKRQYFVLQGHPAHWSDESFAEFERFIDFLQSQNALFMTPSEAASAIYPGDSDAAGTNP